MKKCLMIINATAGKGMVKKALADILDCFVKAGYEIQITLTQARNDAKKLAMQAGNDFDLLVCSGGDGTLNEVVSGLLQLSKEQRPPLGYIPAGTTNDFATSLGIDKRLDQAAMQIIEGKPFLIDIGRFNERSFMYVAAFGLFTQVAYSTPQDAKNMFGRVAYILEGVKSLANVNVYDLTIELEDETIQGDFIYGQISNSTSVGGFSNVGDQIVLDDGYFEMLFVYRPNNPLDLQVIIADLLTRNLKSNWLVYRHVKQVKIRSTKPMEWTLDGEFAGSIEEANIEIINKELNIMVDKNYETNR